MPQSDRRVSNGCPHCKSPLTFWEPQVSGDVRKICTACGQTFPERRLEDLLKFKDLKKAFVS